MKGKIFAGLILLLGAAALFLVVSPTGLAIQEPALVVGYRNHLMYLPVFVAEEKNLFEKHELNVELRKFDKTSHLLLALEKGDVDASFGGVNLLDFFLATQRGASSRLFAVTPFVKDRRTTCLVSKNYAEVNQIGGKKIGYVDSPIGLAWAQATFEALDLDYSGFIPLENSLLLESVVSGSTAAVFLIEPSCVKAESLGLYTLVDEPIANYFADNVYLTGSVVSSKAPRENIRALVATYDEAVELIRSNPAEAKRILSKYAKLEPQLGDRLDLPRFLKSTELNAAQLQASITVLKQKQLLDSQFEAQFVYAS